MNYSIGSCRQFFVRISWNFLIIGLICCCSNTTAQDAQISRLPRVPLTEAAVLGQGYAYSIGSMRAISVDSAQKNTIDTQGIDYDLKYIDDYNELARQLSISASASYGAGGAGGSARANFLSSSSMSRRNAYVLVRMTVESRTESWSEFMLVPSAVTSAAASAENFFSSHGDSFVSGITYGGELFALMEFSAANSSESQSLRVAVKAGVGNLSGGISLEQKVRSLTIGKNVSVRYVQTGGGTGRAITHPAAGSPGAPAMDTGGGVITLTPEQLIFRMRDFPREVREFPSQVKPLYGELKDYSVVNNWPAGIPRPVPGPLSQRLDSVVRAYHLVREELATINDAMTDAAYQSALSQNSANERQPYLVYLQQQMERAILHVASNPREVGAVPMLTFEQYRAELALSLPTSIWRGNAGELCDVTEPDTERTARCLFGAAERWKFERWPVIKSAVVHRGWYGEKDPRVGPRNLLNWAGTFHIPCATNYEQYAKNLCGKKADDDGRFAFVSSVPSTTFSGNRCGYEAVNIACVELEKPAVESKNLLSTFIDGSATTQLDSLMVTKNDNGQVAEFTVSPGCAPAFGAFEATVKSGREKKIIKGYWRREKKESFLVAQPFPPGVEVSTPTDVSIAMLKTYCEIPVNSILAQKLNKEHALKPANEEVRKKAIMEALKLLSPTVPLR